MSVGSLSVLRARTADTTRRYQLVAVARISHAHAGSPSKSNRPNLDRKWTAPSRQGHEKSCNVRAPKIENGHEYQPDVRDGGKVKGPGERTQTCALLLAFSVGAVACLLGAGSPATPSAPAVPAMPITVAVPPSVSGRPAGSCATLLSGLAGRDQLAQLVMAGADPGRETSTTALVRDDHVGALFIGGTSTRLLTGGRLTAIRAMASIPPLIAVDEEGGRVQRIDDLDGTTPSARALATTATPDQARDLGHRRGRQLLSRGVTMDLAPVADVSDAPANSVIGDRSFSAEPAVVTRYAGAFAAGLRTAGVIPVLKHFPGHGTASGDSHRELPRTPPLAVLENHDLEPYETLIPAGAPVVMLGHLDVPGLTGGSPASLSAEAYRLLRGKYRFDGVAMTDDLGAMRAITNRFGLPEAAKRAIAAGADLVLWSSPMPVAPVLDQLQHAVATGELAQTRVREAVTRVLHLKTGCAR
ncbi:MULTISPECIES: glycoside hydrolase family 3 N-terminal domain-containing protein [unclassified Amycolatopsis]|uniref:glycoside hydrolase family 3 N-terminal domain-containing protein n=1 Tax=unclassified Amycolatopsis TaxID=2618356 RepID=UPI002876EA97|nr:MULTISPECIES: glycoside hydrolase family 3 N-terminal domain-containing protein [unclassified Amycolatopsis]MDS0133222.1 glycoside hydrolase family 3 protein [Amycolatopsis sp. 505]MDS0146452.1 glycoside hydrolase family 3 protein [Amycolatopsis sp. CM201R]